MHRAIALPTKSDNQNRLGFLTSWDCKMSFLTPNRSLFQSACFKGFLGLLGGLEVDFESEDLPVLLGQDFRVILCGETT